MLIKTQQFINQLEKDIQLLSLDKRVLNFKGSYLLKQIGDYLTDIDCNQKHYPNASLSAKIIAMIKKLPKQFTFIKMSCGKYMNIKPPWRLNSDGSCNFKYDDVLIWLNSDHVKKVLPEKLYKHVYTTLTNPFSIIELAKLTEELSDYSNVTWRLEDLEKGRLYKHDKLYIISDILRQPEYCLLRFIYKFEQDYIPIDFAIKLIDDLDKNHYFEYYTHDWYKIVKFFKFHFINHAVNYIQQRMKPLEADIAIINKIKLIRIMTKNIQLFNDAIIPVQTDLIKFCSGLGYDYDEELEEKLKQKVTDFSEKLFHELKNELKPEFLLQTMKYYTKMIHGATKVAVSDLKTTKTNPFFFFELDQFEFLFDLSIRASIEPEEFIYKMKNICITYKVEPTELIKIFNQEKICSKNKCKVLFG